MFTILLREDVAVDPRAHGEAIARRLAIPLLEAKMLVRKGRGIFLEHLAEEAARAIAADLERGGLRVSVIRESDIPELPKPRKVARIERGDESFSYRLAGSDESGTIPWDALSLVSCGLVSRAQSGVALDHVRFEGVPALHTFSEEDREVVRENLIRKLEQRPPAVGRASGGKSVFERIDEGRRAKAFVDLVTEDLGTWLRVGMDEFGYVLTPGAVQMGSSWGMDALMRDLRGRAAGAFSDMTLRILAADDFASWILPQIEELNRYTTWALLLQHFRLEPEIPWAELEG